MADQQIQQVRGNTFEDHKLENIFSLLGTILFSHGFYMQSIHKFEAIKSVQCTPITDVGIKVQNLHNPIQSIDFVQN